MTLLQRTATKLEKLLVERRPAEPLGELVDVAIEFLRASHIDEQVRLLAADAVVLQLALRYPCETIRERSVEPIRTLTRRLRRLGEASAGKADLSDALDAIEGDLYRGMGEAVPTTCGPSGRNTRHDGGGGGPCGSVGRQQ